MAKHDPVYVHYPYHPLCGKELKVFVAARSAKGSVTVEDASQRRLKIPLWMLRADAARYEVSDAPTVDLDSLLRLLELCVLHCDKLVSSDTDSHMESDHEATLVNRTSSDG